MSFHLKYVKPKTSTSKFIKDLKKAGCHTSHFIEISNHVTYQIGRHGKHQ